MPEEDETPGTRSPFQSRVSGMRNATLIIGFIGYIILSRVWASYGYFNSWYALGGWGLVGIFVMFFWGPLVVANRSPKFSSNKMGGTIASPQPILEVPSQGGWPDMVLYDPGSVKGLGLYEHTMSAKAYVWMPKALAYIVGEEDRGVNVVANCHLMQLSEHCELPPHLYDAMVMMRRPAYKSKMTCFLGLFPLMTNELTSEQVEYYRRRCEQFGVSRAAFDGEVEGRVPFKSVFEEYASATSRFRPDEKFTKGESMTKMLESIMKSQNSMIEKLRRDNSFFKSEITALQGLYRVRKEATPEPTWRDRLPMGGDSRPVEREEPDQRSRYQ